MAAFFCAITQLKIAPNIAPNIASISKKPNFTATGANQTEHTRHGGLIDT